MTKWPFSKEDEIMSKLGGPSVGLLHGYWESGMHTVHWVLEPYNIRDQKIDKTDLVFLDSANYIAEIFDPGTNVLLYKGNITLEFVTSSKTKLIPAEISYIQWLKWAKMKCPARFTLCT